MHHVREASMVTYDFDFTQSGNTVTFKLERPKKLSLEANGERFYSLHIFVKPVERMSRIRKTRERSS